MVSLPTAYSRIWKVERAVPGWALPAMKNPKNQQEPNHDIMSQPVVLIVFFALKGHSWWEHFPSSPADELATYGKAVYSTWHSPSACAYSFHTEFEPRLHILTWWRGRVQSFYKLRDIWERKWDANELPKRPLTAASFVLYQPIRRWPTLSIDKHSKRICLTGDAALLHHDGRPYRCALWLD